MATSEVLSAPASAFPVNNKLQRKVNVLREVIESEKLEVRRIGREMRESISRKEEEVIRGLDAVWESVNARIEEKKRDIQKKIEKIEKREKEMNEELESLFRSCGETFFLQNSVVHEAIESIKAKMDISIPFVKVTWRVDELLKSINRMCYCEKQIKEVTHYQREWSRCKWGMRKTQLLAPHGIAISNSNTIYVATKSWFGDQVRIFSKEGEWIKGLEYCSMRNQRPENIVFLCDSIYVQCEKSILRFNEFSEKSILRFNEFSEKKISEKKFSEKSYDFPLRGICTDKTNIFVGNCSAMKLIILTADLTEEKQITLNTEFYQQGLTEIRDLSFSEEEIYVLLSDSEYPIQSFSKEGILSRCVIQKDSIKDAWYFCIDQQLNLIVSDRGECCVKIFSNEGTLLKPLHLKLGVFDGLSGVAVDKLGSIFVVQNTSHFPPNIIHLFS